MIVLKETLKIVLKETLKIVLKETLMPRLIQSGLLCREELLS